MKCCKRCVTIVRKCVHACFSSAADCCHMCVHMQSVHMSVHRAHSKIHTHVDFSDVQQQQVFAAGDCCHMSTIERAPCHAGFFFSRRAPTVNAEGLRQIRGQPPKKKRSGRHFVGTLQRLPVRFFFTKTDRRSDRAISAQGWRVCCAHGPDPDTQPRRAA